MSYSIFDLLAMICQLMGWFDPSAPNLQYLIWQIAEFFGVHIHIAMG